MSWCENPQLGSRPCPNRIDRNDAFDAGCYHMVEAVVHVPTTGKVRRRKEIGRVTKWLLRNDDQAFMQGIIGRGGQIVRVFSFFCRGFVFSNFFLLFCFECTTTILVHGMNGRKWPVEKTFGIEMKGRTWVSKWHIRESYPRESCPRKSRALVKSSPWCYTDIKIHNQKNRKPPLFLTSPRRPSDTENELKHVTKEIIGKVSPVTVEYRRTKLVVY